MSTETKDWIGDVEVFQHGGGGFGAAINGANVFHPSLPGDHNKPLCQFRIAHDLPSKEAAEEAAREWVSRQAEALGLFRASDARIAELEQDLQSTTDSLGHSSREAEAAIREKQELLAGVNLQLKEIERLRDRIAELESQLADYRENGASAVRHAPTSAHWSRELRRLFGDDARAGIDKIEAQVRTAGAEALEKMGERLRKMLKEGGSSTAWRYCFRQAADECETEARRLRGEGE